MMQGEDKDRLQAEPTYLVVLRALVYAVATFILLYGLALGAGLVGGMIGAVLAVFAAQLLLKRRVRPGAVVAMSAGAVLGGVLMDQALTGPGLAAGLLGVERTLELVDLLVFGATLFGVGLALRTLAARYPALAVAEVAAITLSVVRLVAGHRDHAISEPRFISDWAWSQGGDPIVVLLAIGALTLGVVPLLFLVRQRLTRAALSVAVLAMLGLFAFALMRVAGPEPPPPTGGLGLTGDPDDASKARPHPQGGGQGHGQGQGQGDDPTQMPFKDEYPQGEPKPVAIALLHDDYTAPDGYYYFRQTAFSHFNGTRLVRSFMRESDPDLIERFPHDPQEVSDLGRSWRAFHELDTTVALITDHKQPFGLSNPVAFAPLDNPNPNYFRRAYKVTSLAPRLDFRDMLQHQAGDPEWSEALRSQYLGLPDDPRYKELADQLVADLDPRWKDSPVAQALAIRRWMEKNTVYTRRSKHSGAADPTASFLFGSRRGYCVHLAHAMAFLLRARGIPSRVSAGYLVDESRRGSGSTVLIQNQDAHAWAEIFLDGLGWVTMDVSPEQSEDANMAQINPDLQRALGELLRGDKTAGKQVAHQDRTNWGRLAGLVGGPLGTLLLLVLYGVKLWRRMIWRVAAHGQLYRLAYRAALDRAAELGLTRHFGETREAFAARCAQTLPALGPMTHAHLRRALGAGEDLTKERWLALHEDLSAQAGARFPWWRRLLGVANPLSWTRAR